MNKTSFLLLILIPAVAWSENSRTLEKVTVTASREEALASAGSVSRIDAEEIEKETRGVADIGRILRDVPGVNVQDEDGFGLRPNIGFRGVPSERSAKITLMEDGVLIAPAPYASPSAYYFPPAGRMSSIEVLKGASQLKYGPYTTGGALNLISTPIPEESSGTASVAFGTDELSRAHITAGSSFDNAGFLLETWQFETNGFKDIDGTDRDPEIEIEDYQYKFRVNTDPDKEFYSELLYKGGFYDQRSFETYLGLTESDFGMDPNRRYAGSQLDNIDVDHIQHHVTHLMEWGDDVSVSTTAYYNKTERNWYKLQSAGGSGLSPILASPQDFAEELGWIRGEDSPDGALSLRNNKRDYYSRGIQSKVVLDRDNHLIEAGVRYHEDEEDRFQSEDRYTMVNSSLMLFERGAPGSQSNRVSSADAWSFYVQDLITVGDFEFLPVVRYETIDYTREDYGSSDPERTGDNLRTVNTDVDKVIPGLSAQYFVSDEFSLFAGVHRGFSPPGPSSNTEVKEEDSVNFEAGFSLQRDAAGLKTVLFYTDYDNLLGADTLSSGGEGTGDLFNGGEASVLGVEFEAYADLMGGDSGVRIPLNLTYTYSDAEFDSTFDSDFFGDVTSGDPVPYIPEHQGAVSAGVGYGAFDIALEGQFAKAMTTAPGSDLGDTKTDSFMVFDLLTSYGVTDSAEVFFNVENIFDREYVAARRPAGARPGLPLTAVGGVRVTF